MKLTNRTTALLLAAICAGGLVLRLWSIRHGFPYVYNYDEANHFVSHALMMLESGSLDPHYFDNPSGLTYLLLGVFELWQAFGLSDGNLQIHVDTAFTIARVCVSVCGIGAVVAIYFAGKEFFDRSAGLVAAALLSFAVLPVVYSRLALNDVMTLPFVALSLFFCAKVANSAGKRYWYLCGLSIGLAVVTKYTTGLLVLPFLLAVTCHCIRSGWRFRVIIDVLLAGVIASSVCALVLYYGLADFDFFLERVTRQSDIASTTKIGQEPSNGGIGYYISTIGWGFGLLAGVAALAGAVLLIVKERFKAAILIALPIALLIFLGLQGRYFARWLLPIYPALALLAGFTVSWVACLPILRKRGWIANVTVATLALLLIAQGAMANVHIAKTLSQPDTCQLMRNWVKQNIRQRSSAMVEPFLPVRFFGRRDSERRLITVSRVEMPHQAYAARLKASDIDGYRHEGVCWVISGSHRERGLEARLTGAKAYYKRLDRESDQIVFSPYRNGQTAMRFNFDLSHIYVSRKYVRPGPVIRIHHLHDCTPKMKK